MGLEKVRMASEESFSVRDMSYTLDEGHHEGASGKAGSNPSDSRKALKNGVNHRHRCPENKAPMSIPIGDSVTMLCTLSHQCSLLRRSGECLSIAASGSPFILVFSSSRCFFSLPLISSPTCPLAAVAGISRLVFSAFNSLSFLINSFAFQRHYCFW